MGAPRSPSYPSISLSDAMSKARQIYQKEHMSMMTPRVVAEAMGYTGINGASLKTIAALKKWGLLDGRAEDLRLTKDAQTLAIDDSNTPDYRAALARSASAPEVFSEISKQFPGPASERNIAVYLEKQGFIPDAAATVAKYYKESLALISGNPVAYNGRDDEPVEPTMSQPQTAPAPASRPTQFYGGGPAAPEQPFVTAAAGTPFRVIQDGKQLTIQAVVDLKGLRKLKAMLATYETLLEMMQDDDAEPEASLNIDAETLKM